MLTLSLATVLSMACNATAAPPLAASIMPVRVQDVSIGGAFWGPRLAVLKDATLAAVRHQCDITGRLSNFDKAAAKIRGEANPGAFEGLLFNDSDVYKMMEGWACIVATEPDAARRESLDKELDALIARVGAAQESDGYIDTYYTLKAGIDKRLTREQDDHETYCMGHLIEAGAVHYQATSKRNFLNIAVKAADFLRSTYGPDKFTTPPGHQEVEIALIKLSAATGDRKYADLAHDIVEYRGRPHRALDGTISRPWGDLAQDVLPAADQREVMGHAVRAGYYYSAMADLARLGHSEYTPALDSLWEDVTNRRIFVTGGIGPSGRNEGFTVPFDIPTTTAYQETCASIALCLWAYRMFLLEGDPKYMEQFERTMYNAVLAGVSLDGRQFFYVNPLASRGGHHRQDWFSCACCPPNIVRFFAELGQYAYATKGDTIYVNLFMESQATFAMPGGAVEIVQKTDYPFGGKITINVVNRSDREIMLAIRPSPGMTTMVKGMDGYGAIRFSAHEGGQVQWEIPMHPVRVYADPRVKASLGRVAIMRGPLVYAAESIDNAAASDGLTSLMLPPTTPITETTGGDEVPTLVADGFTLAPQLSAAVSPPESTLYRQSDPLTPVKITLRPYFMWANRGDASMRVWLPESPQFLDPKPPNGAKISASHVYAGDTIEALADGITPDPAKGSGDGSIPRMTFWPHRGSTEWVQYDFDRPRKIRTASVYWFDDTGIGACRIPREAVVEYKDGDNWKPVPNDAQGRIAVAKDTTNSTSFAEITTSGLRLRISLQEGMSAGILEWSFGR